MKENNPAADRSCVCVWEGGARQGGCRSGGGGGGRSRFLVVSVSGIESHSPLPSLHFHPTRDRTELLEVKLTPPLSRRNKNKHRPRAGCRYRQATTLLWSTGTYLPTCTCTWSTDWRHREKYERWGRARKKERNKLSTASGEEPGNSPAQPSPRNRAADRTQAGRQAGTRAHTITSKQGVGSFRVSDLAHASHPGPIPPLPLAGWRRERGERSKSVSLGTRC